MSDATSPSKTELARMLEQFTSAPSVESGKISPDRAAVFVPAGTLASAVRLVERWHRYKQDPEAGVRDTSIRARAEHLEPLSSLQMEVLRCLTRCPRGYGLTNSEICHRLPRYSPRSVQPRTADLSRAGLVHDMGSRRENGRGNYEIIWELTNEGDRYAQHHFAEDYKAAGRGDQGQPEPEAVESAPHT